MKDKSIVIEKIGEILNVLVFSFATIGAIMVMAFFYKSNNGFSEMPLGFIKQVLYYVGIMTVCIIICFTDIMPLKLRQVYKNIIVGLGIYIIGLVYFSGCSINPFQSIGLFVVYTMWFLFISFLAVFVWRIYQRILSNQYMKYLEDYQEELGKE